jgi:hypothetical protein
MKLLSSLIHIECLYTKLVDQWKDLTSLHHTNHAYSTYQTFWIHYSCRHSWQRLATIKNRLLRRIFEFKGQEVDKTAHWWAPYSSQSAISVIRSRVIVCAGEDRRTGRTWYWIMWFRRESSAKPLQIWWLKFGFIENKEMFNRQTFQVLTAVLLIPSSCIES